MIYSLLMLLAPVTNDNPATVRKADLMKAMSGHIPQSGEVIGWYKR